MFPCYGCQIREKEPPKRLPEVYYEAISIAHDMSIRLLSSRIYHSALSDRVKASCFYRESLGTKPMFNQAQEEEIEKHVLLLTSCILV